jgi:2-oxoglutarate dehydrogenase E2 component (dihydrolipoamide succinyltransferase)
MGEIKVILPAMGEGIFEATITQWLVNEGDTVQEDDSIVEIATDKVDSEVSTPKTGILKKILVKAGEIAKVGQEIALVYFEDNGESSPIAKSNSTSIEKNDTIVNVETTSPIISALITNSKNPAIPFNLSNGKFLSPLVRSIADKENISVAELERIKGTGLEGRITKEDIVNFLNAKQNKGNTPSGKSIHDGENVEIIEMNRMRMLISEHMLQSKRISPHVTSFHEVDLTNLVNWRDKNKEEFLIRHGEKITYTPIFINAIAKAIKKYPLINVSVDGNNIILKKKINVGMAAALPDGNLIVPVIQQANEINPVDLVKKVNDLANRARNKQLLPHEIQGGTFTLTNVGTFGNLSGTPIINQPQVAILAIGAIKKRPAVFETSEGDFIGIKHQMILSLSYDHRVVDGSLGGMFLKQIADNLESFNGNEWL